MGLLESVGWGLAVVGAGILSGYVLFWLYAIHERVDLRERYAMTVPDALRHWSLYGAVGLAVVTVMVYDRQPSAAILFAVPAVGNAVIWARDTRRAAA